MGYYWHDKQNYSCSYNTSTLSSTTLHYVALLYATLSNSYSYEYNCSYNNMSLITPHHSYNCKSATPITPHHSYNCNCTTRTTLHYNYNSTTFELQLHYTTLHPAIVRDVITGTIATIATVKKNIAPNTFRSISGLSMPSMIRKNQTLLWISCFWNFRHGLVLEYFVIYVQVNLISSNLVGSIQQILGNWTLWAIFGCCAIFIDDCGCSEAASPQNSAPTSLTQQNTVAGRLCNVPSALPRFWT